MGIGRNVKKDFDAHTHTNIHFHAHEQPSIFIGAPDTCIFFGAHTQIDTNRHRTDTDEKTSRQAGAAGLSRVFNENSRLPSLSPKEPLANLVHPTFINRLQTLCLNLREHTHSVNTYRILTQTFLNLLNAQELCLNI